MKTITNCILFACFIFIPFNLVFAQTDTIHVQLTQPGIIKGCHSNVHLIDSMMVVDTTTLSITVQIRDSVGIADTSCTGITPVIVSLMGSNPLIDSVEYNPFTATWSCLLYPGTISFSLAFAIDCSVLQLSNSGIGNISTVQLWQQWSSTSGTFFDLNNSGADTLLSNNILSPWLVDESPSPYLTAYGLTDTLYFQYKNNGVSANIKFAFLPDDGYNCSAYTEENLEYGILDSTGFTASYFPYIPSDWISIFLPTYHSIQIRRAIKIIDCVDSCNQENGIFKWRCDSIPDSDTLFCETCQKIFDKNYSIIESSTLKAKLHVSRISPNLNTVLYDYSCTDDSLLWVFRVKNIGTGTAAFSSILLQSNGTGNSYLTDISRGNVSFDTSGCINCTFVVSDSLKTAQSFCAISNPLFSFNLQIQDFAGGDSIDFSFYTHRCCSENDSLLLNIEKFFNHWRFVVDGIDSCGALSIIPAASPNQPVFTGVSSIAPSAVDNNYDLDLDLSFLPITSNLSVQQGATFGDSTTMEINFHGMFDSFQPYDYQILGCDNDPNCLYKGYLRARIYTEVGLHISNFNSVYFHNDTIGDWMPEFFHTDKDSLNGCLDGNYYFYFNLSDSMAREMLEVGQMKFTLVACCKGVDELPATKYTISYHLLMNPDSCDAISPPINVLSDPICTSCCWLPLSSEGDEIEVMCPGCPHPGIIVDKYRMQRLNYGLQDSDNDMIADTTSQIFKDDTYFNSHPQLRTFFSMHGDQLWDILDSHFETGSNYTYYQISDSPSTAKFNYLQLHRIIEHSAPSQMNLVVKDFDLYIDVPDSSGGCKDCQAQYIADTLFRTIQQNHISNANLSTYLTRIDSMFFFTFGIDSLNDNLFQNIVFIDSLSVFSEFEPEQRYRLIVRYDVCGNFEPSTTNGWKQSKISNFMWLTGSQKYDTYAPDPPPSPSFPVDQSFADSCIFYCEKFGGRHFFVSNETLNPSGATNNGCSNTLKVQAQTRIGGMSSGDIFPYEIRTPAYKPVRYRISLPPVISLGSGTMNSSSILGTQSALQPFNISPLTGSYYEFTDTSYSIPQCFTSNSPDPLDSSLYTFDQFMGLNFTFDVEMDSCIEDFVIENFTIVRIDFTDNSTNCIPSSLNLCQADTVTKNVTSIAVNIHQPNPELNIYLSAPTTYASDTSVCWNVIIRNPRNNSLILPLTSTAAYNLFLIPPDSFMIDYLTGWSFDLIGTPPPQYSDTNGVIHIANSLLVNDTLLGKLCANFVFCPDSAIINDTLSFSWGWNCDGYPIPETSIACFEDTSQIHLTFYQGTISETQIKFHSPGTFLCDTVYFGTYFSATDSGYVFPKTIGLTLIPQGLTIIEAYLLNPDNPSDSILLPGTGPMWGISDSVLLALGFVNFGFRNPEKLKVSYYALTSCGYNFTLPSHYISYYNYCNEEKTTTINFSTTVADLGSHCNDCFTIEKIALQDSASVGDTVSFQIIVCGNNLNTDTLLVSDHLPLNFTVTYSDTLVAFVPAFGCDTLIVSGFYEQPGFCGDSSMINTATIYYGSDSLSSSDCVEIYAPCAATADTILPDSSFATSYPGGFSGITVYLQGRFYVDTNGFSIQNCLILVNTGGQIVVLPGAALLVDSSTVIQGCDFMWQGINVESTGSFGIRHYSVIRDANWAVFANDSTSIKFLNSSFEDNIRSLYIPPNNSGTNLVWHAITGNAFGMASSTFKQAYPGQPPFGTLPFAGIEANDVHLSIGSAMRDSNFFYNMNTGILGHRSIIEVDNNKFVNIQKDTSYHNLWDGTAMSSVGKLNSISGKLIVKPLASGNFTVERSLFGIYTDYSSLQADRIDMDDVNTGVFVTRTEDYLSSFITRCTIFANSTGINFNFNPGASVLEATDNTIVLHTSRSVGIRMFETNNAVDAPYSISRNNIIGQNSRWGIVGYNLLKPLITENTVRMSSTLSSSLLMDGISISGSERAKVACNEVIGESPSDTNKVAIKVTLSDNSEISCNVVDSTGIGVYFDGASPGTILRANTINNHFQGLRLTGSAIIDPQSMRGNMWTGTYGSGFGAVNFNSLNPLIVAQNRFDVQDSILGTIYHPVNFVVCAFCQWFVYTPGQPDECTGQDTCWQVGSGNFASDDHFMEKLIAADSLRASEYEPEAKSMTRQYLFDKLKENPLLILEESEFEVFMSTLEQSDKDYLYRIKKLIATRSNFDSQFRQLRYTLDSLTNILLPMIQENNSLILNGAANSETLALQNEQYSNEITQVQGQIKSLLEQFSLQRVLLSDSATNFNNQLLPEDLITLNEKAVNELELQLVLNGSLSQYQIDQLEYIAIQCPVAGGKAVFRARARYYGYNPDIEYDDQATCLAQGYYRSESVTSVSQKISKPAFIKPNPASSRATLVYDLINTSKPKFIISDLLGRKLYISSLNEKENEFTFSTNMIPDGMYIYKVMDGEKLLHKGKFTIQH